MRTFWTLLGVAFILWLAGFVLWPTWLILAFMGFIFIVMTLIRWFDETAEAVDNGWWDRVQLLVVFPFVVWMFPAKVGAGRANPVPHHEPVRGFGTVPKARVP